MRKYKIKLYVHVYPVVTYEKTTYITANSKFEAKCIILGDFDKYSKIGGSWKRTNGKLKSMHPDKTRYKSFIEESNIINTDW